MEEKKRQKGNACKINIQMHKKHNIDQQALSASEVITILNRTENHETRSKVRLIMKWAATWQNQQIECAPSEDSYQPGHPPSLIRVFAVHVKKAWFLSYPLSAQQRLWSGWANAQADLSLRWMHSHIVGFVMSRLKCLVVKITKTHKLRITPRPIALERSVVSQCCWLIFT